MARNNGVLSVSTTSIDECAAHAAGSRPMCLLTTPKAFSDPVVTARLMDLAEPVFHRVVVVLIVDPSPNSQIGKRLVWDAVGPNADEVEVAGALRFAIAAAKLRLLDWDTVDEFRRRYGNLTEDEADVLTAVCDGRLNKQIAADFGISLRTVEQRRRRVFTKMGVNSAVALARQVGLFEALSHQVIRRGIAQPMTISRSSKSPPTPGGRPSGGSLPAQR